MRRLGVAVIGAGNWARYAHLPALRLLEQQYRLIVVAAATGKSAAEAALLFDVQTATDRVEEAVEHPQVDVVVVLARAPQHSELVHRAIEAGKHVYCEWPLGLNAAEARQMLSAAERSNILNVVGLQRRVAASVCWLRHLIRTDFVGEVRSVRLHVSEPNLHRVRRAAWAAFSANPTNFSNVFSIYGGHFLDVLNTIFGSPTEICARLVNQFPQLTVLESGDSIASTSPDQLVMCGQYGNGAVLNVHIEGGKHCGSGLSLAVTGTCGDLLLSNSAAFRNAEDHTVLGGKQASRDWSPLPVPEPNSLLPPSDLPAAVLEVASVYAGFARALEGGRSEAATFADAAKLHEQLEQIECASKTRSWIPIADNFGEV